MGKMKFPRRYGTQGLARWLHAWRWRTWQCLIDPPPPPPNAVGRPSVTSYAYGLLHTLLASGRLTDCLYAAHKIWYKSAVIEIEGICLDFSKNGSLWMRGERWAISVIVRRTFCHLNAFFFSLTKETFRFYVLKEY